MLLLLLNRFSRVRLCDPIDGSPPGSPVLGILQARTLEWVAISFSNAWKWKVKVKSLSRVRLLATPWTAAHQAPPSMGFSRPEYWSGLPLPSLTVRITFFKSVDSSHKLDRLGSESTEGGAQESIILTKAYFYYQTLLGNIALCLWAVGLGGRKWSMKTGRHGLESLLSHFPILWPGK